MLITIWGKKDSERLRELKINYDAEMISIYKYLSLRDKIRAFLFRLFPDLYTCFFTARHQ